jgi:hypothetical protein
MRDEAAFALFSGSRSSFGVPVGLSQNPKLRSADYSDYFTSESGFISRKRADL